MDRRAAPRLPARADRFLHRGDDARTRGTSTVCRAVAMHRDEADRNLHAEMGFHDGWGTVFDQLVTYAPGI